MAEQCACLELGHNEALPVRRDSAGFLQGCLRRARERRMRIAWRGQSCWRQFLSVYRLITNND